jgi:outer membrane murein-binding lipoprotein Lpp
VQQAKLLVAGFVAGLLVASGAVLLLRDDAAREQERARVVDLRAQVDRLENAVTKLSALANDAHSGTPAPTNVPASVAALAPAPQKPPTAQLQAIADANALVDLGLQSGRWTAEQQEDLGLAITNLDVKDQDRILARVSKAINDGQLRLDPTR